MPSKTLTVLITHPKFRNGTAYTHHQKIGWGHSEDWKNYSSLYLAHEIMHFLLPIGPVYHDLIYILIDTELRKVLDKNCKLLRWKQSPIEKLTRKEWQKFKKIHHKENILELGKYIIN